MVEVSNLSNPFISNSHANPLTVGFTGSGQTMRKDPTRSRHIYQPNEDLD